MRIIFDLGHPAHFHLFKHTIKSLKEKGDEVEIVARQKDCLFELLDKANWPYYPIRRKKSGLIYLAWQNLRTFFAALKLARRKQTDFIIGTSIVAGLASRLSGATSLVFNEDDARVVPMFAKLAYPPAHYVVTPKSLKYEDHGKKHIKYQGYHELAYLHPNYFKPDKSVLNLLGLSTGERYFLVRLVSLTAHHDIKAKGLSTDKAEFLVNHLSKYGKVFISAERVVNEQLKPYLLPTPADKIFDVMAFADMVIGDSQTMVAEAAVLGTPSLRCNSFVGRLSYLEELEHKYGLTVGIRPENFEKLIDKINEWLSNPNLKKDWMAKRQRMLTDCIALTDWIVKLLEKLKRGIKWQNE